MDGWYQTWVGFEMLYANVIIFKYRVPKSCTILRSGVVSGNSPTSNGAMSKKGIMDVLVQKATHLFKQVHVLIGQVGYVNCEGHYYSISF